MANIVRCELPDGVHRFSPFTVSDYRDFLLVRNDMNTKSPEDQEKLIEELQNDYFSDIPKEYRAFVFLKVYLSSIGKTKIPVKVECPKCGKAKMVLINFHQEAVELPVIDVSGLRLKFKHPTKNYKENIAGLITENILSVEDSNGVYQWSELSTENKVQVVEAIDIETLELIIKKLNIFDFVLKYSCCDSHEIHYTNFMDIFKLLLNPDEVFTFYKINHLIVKQGYDLSSVMNMIPIERSITLSLIEKELAQK